MIGAVGYKVITLNRNQKELYQTMNTFTKKSLHVALAGLGTLGLAGAADAVMVNPNGLGQVLIYPYYTVRSPAGAGIANYNTLLSIVNTTNSVKAVKVRFREGKASAEVLDFNVFLSPFDMWTAAVEPGAGTPGVTPLGPYDNGAQIETTDTSCTIPDFTDGVAVPFRSGAYEGDAVGDDGLDRTTEGYFEVFEMATYAPGSVTATNATHSKGVPVNCSLVTDSTALSEAQPPLGGLSGGATLINVLTGDAFTEDATALINFTNAPIYFNTGVDTPNFGDALPPIGVAVSATGQILTGVYGTGTLDPEKAVAMSLQKTSVINEFVLDASTLSGTDWVLTFPGKYAFVDPNGKSFSTLPFIGKLGKTGACDPATLTTYNREEGKITPSGPDFSPSPGIPGFNLCWEANVISFKNPAASGIAQVLGSGNSYTVTTGFTNGWGVVTYSPLAINVATTASVYDPILQTVAPATSLTFSGLPTIGFAVQTFVNGTLTDSTGKLIQSSYGGNFGHRYTGPQ
jgi:hypothetical protein